MDWRDGLLMLIGSLSLREAQLTEAVQQLAQRVNSLETKLPEDEAMGFDVPHDD